MYSEKASIVFCSPQTHHPDLFAKKYTALFSFFLCIEPACVTGKIADQIEAR
jgi:hypothetical protein